MISLYLNSNMHTYISSFTDITHQNSRTVQTAHLRATSYDLLWQFNEKLFRRDEILKQQRLKLDLYFTSLSDCLKWILTSIVMTNPCKYIRKQCDRLVCCLKKRIRSSLQKTKHYNRFPNCITILRQNCPRSTQSNYQP